MDGPYDPAADPWEGVSATLIHADIYPCPREWAIPPYVANNDALFYVLRGQGWLECDGERFEAEPGDLFIARRGQSGAAGHDPKRPVTVFSCGFSLRGPGNVDPLRALALPYRLRLPASERRRIEEGYLTLVHDFRETTARSRLAARGALLRLLSETLRLVESLPPERQSGARTLPGDETRAAEVLAFIDAHVAEALSLRALARVAHLSPVYFAKLFRRQTGQSPMSYVRQRRMELAKAMLASGDESIERIAARVGFTDPFHFSRIFRRLIGQAPSAYRAGLKHPFQS